MSKRDYILIAAILFDRRETIPRAAFNAAKFKEACGAD